MSASRYADVPILPTAVYAGDRPLLGQAPAKVVRTLGRRYTSREAPVGSRVRVTLTGESLASIAMSEYGDARLWYALADHNPHVFDPMDLSEGTDLVIPPKSSL